MILTMLALREMYCTSEDLIAVARKTTPPQKAHKADIKIVRRPPVTWSSDIAALSQMELPEVHSVSLRQIIRIKPNHTDVLIVWGMPGEEIAGEEFRVW